MQLLLTQSLIACAWKMRHERMRCGALLYEDTVATQRVAAATSRVRRSAAHPFCCGIASPSVAFPLSVLVSTGTIHSSATAAQMRETLNQIDVTPRGGFDHSYLVAIISTTYG